MAIQMAIKKAIGLKMEKIIQTKDTTMGIMMDNQGTQTITAIEITQVEVQEGIMADQNAISAMKTILT